MTIAFRPTTYPPFFNQSSVIVCTGWIQKQAKIHLEIGHETMFSGSNLMFLQQITWDIIVKFDIYVQNTMLASNHF